jgi:hypothetical protein
MIQSPDITKTSERPRVFISHKGIDRLHHGLEAMLGQPVAPRFNGLRRELEALLRRQKAKPPVAPPPGGLRTAAEAAHKLHCSVKTLNGHVASGDLRYVSIGKGTKRRRKMFTDADLNEFIAAQTRKVTPCPSTKTRARHSGNSTSSGTVIDFTAPRKPPTSAKPKK